MSPAHESEPPKPWYIEVPWLHEQIDRLRKEVDDATRLVKWLFAISWIAIVAMYGAAFMYYLPAKLDPLTERLAKVESKVDGLQTSVAKMDGKLEILISLLSKELPRKSKGELGGHVPGARSSALDQSAAWEKPHSKNVPQTAARSH